MHVIRSGIGDVRVSSRSQFPLVPVIRGYPVLPVKEPGLSRVQIEWREIELGEMNVLAEAPPHPSPKGRESSYTDQQDHSPVNAGKLGEPKNNA